MPNATQPQPHPTIHAHNHHTHTPHQHTTHGTRHQHTPTHHHTPVRLWFHTKVRSGGSVSRQQLGLLHIKPMLLESALAAQHTEPVHDDQRHTHAHMHAHALANTHAHTCTYTFTSTHARETNQRHMHTISATEGHAAEFAMSDGVFFPHSRTATCVMLPGRKHLGSHDASRTQTRPEQTPTQERRRWHRQSRRQ